MRPRTACTRCSTDKQDLATQRAALLDLDVAEDRIYTMYDTGDYAISHLVELFAVSRPTVYRVLRRTTGADAPSAAV